MDILSWTFSVINHSLSWIFNAKNLQKMLKILTIGEFLFLFCLNYEELVQLVLEKSSKILKSRPDYRSYFRQTGFLKALSVHFKLLADYFRTTNFLDLVCSFFANPEKQHE